jgi:hypothetical protein
MPKRLAPAPFTVLHSASTLFGGAEAVLAQATTPSLPPAP